MFLWPQDRQYFISDLHQYLDQLLCHDVVDLIAKFDYRFTRATGNFNIIVGGKHTGKSTILKNIVVDEFLARKDISTVRAFAGDEAARKEFLTYVHPEHVYDYSEQMMEQQLEIVNWAPRYGPKTLILIDAVGHWFRTDLALNLARLRRTGGILLLATTCWLQELPFEIRMGVDSWFLLRRKSREERERTWRICAGYLNLTPAEFQEVLDAGTQNYGALVVDTHFMPTRLSCYRPVVKRKEKVFAC